MKRLSLLCLLAIACLARLAGQQPDLRENFAEYFAAMQAKRWAVVLDYLPPEIFELSSREEVFAAFESLDADTTTQITFSKAEIVQNPLAMSQRDHRYALLPYRYQMHIELLIEDSTERAQLVSFYESFYGSEDLSYDATQRTLTLTMEKQLYAVLLPKQDRWRFIENNENSETLLEKVVPARIRSDLERGLRIERGDH